jgi:hypothetical protein
VSSIEAEIPCGCLHGKIPLYNQLHNFHHLEELLYRKTDFVFARIFVFKKTYQLFGFRNTSGFLYLQSSI